MQLFALFTLASLFTTILAAPLSVPGVGSVDIKVPSLPIVGSILAPATGSSGGSTTPAAPANPASLDALQLSLAGIKPAKTVAEAVALIKKIDGQVQVAVRDTIGALKTGGTKYPQSFNPPAYLLRQLEAYIATLPGIVAGDSRFKAAAADLDKTLASLFINTMNGASHIQVVNSLLQAGLNSQILTGTVFKQTVRTLLGN